MALSVAVPGPRSQQLGSFNAIGYCITSERTGQGNQRQNGSAPGWEHLHLAAIDDHSLILRTPAAKVSAILLPHRRALLLLKDS